jgi:ATP-dependent DNA helicase RecG
MSSQPLRVFEWQVGQERLVTFVTHDLLFLDLVRRERPIPDRLRDHLAFLVDQGLIERTGRGRGVHYLLSRDLYALQGQKGVYTRQRGLDGETNKPLLLKHILDNAHEGSQLSGLVQVLPALSSDQVQWLLRELQVEGQHPQSGSHKGDQMVSRSGRSWD